MTRHFGAVIDASGRWVQQIGQWFYLMDGTRLHRGTTDHEVARAWLAEVDTSEKDQVTP